MHQTVVNIQLKYKSLYRAPNSSYDTAKRQIHCTMHHTILTIQHNKTLLCAKYQTLLTIQSKYQFFVLCSKQFLLFKQKANSLYYYQIILTIQPKDQIFEPCTKQFLLYGQNTIFCTMYQALLTIQPKDQFFEPCTNHFLLFSQKINSLNHVPTTSNYSAKRSIL